MCEEAFTVEVRKSFQGSEEIKPEMRVVRDILNDGCNVEGVFVVHDNALADWIVFIKIFLRHRFSQDDGKGSR